MFKDIYELIKKYEKIVIARHIGVDPDAMSSSFALKNSILLTFPDKKVRLAGTGSSRFNYFGKFDKNEPVTDNTLLIVVDTPDIRRIDGITDIKEFSDVIKLDHHPFIESFGGIEYIDDTASSAAQVVLEFLLATPMLVDELVAKQIFWGIVSDTNRFMYSNSSSKVFHLVGDLIEKYDLDIPVLYSSLYARPLSEVRLEGYIAGNMIVTDGGVGYIKISNDILEQFHTDAASPGNMIGNFNYIDEIIVWIFITEDVKSENYRVSIRSRGPVINSVAEKYNGGGHKYASGARIYDVSDIDKIITDLNNLCLRYQKEERKENEN